MATLANGITFGWWNTTSNTRWCYLFGDVTRSGNTVTISNVTMYCTFKGSSWAGGVSSTCTYGISGGKTSQSSLWWSFSGYTSNTFNLNGLSFNVSTSQTSQAMFIEEGGDYGYFTVTFPTGAVAPDVPTISTSTIRADGASFLVKVDSYGTPSSASGRYIEACISNVKNYMGTGGARRYASASDTSSSFISVSNSSSGSLNIVGNTKYYYGAYASNTQLTSQTADADMKTFVTRPTPPTASNFTSSGSGEASFTITETSTGSEEKVRLYYRYAKTSEDIEDATWTQAGALGNHQVETVSLSGLEAGTSYTVQVRTEISGYKTPINTYTGAFTTKVLSSIGSYSVVDGAAAGTARVNLHLLFSSAQSDPTIYYQVSYTPIGGSTPTVVSGSGTATGGELDTYIEVPADVAYSVKVRGGLSSSDYGDYSAAVTVDATLRHVGVPTISYSFDTLRENVLVHIGISEYCDSVAVVVADPNGNHQIYSNSISRSSGTWDVVAPLLENGATVSPESVPQFVITATQTYNGENASATATFNTPWRIFGVITRQDGTRENIVGIKILDKNGNIHSGDTTHPFVVK